MTNFIIRRVLQSLLVFAVLSFVCYALMGLMPGDPIDLMVQSNPRLRPEDIARLKTLYGLDLPIHERYFNWMKSILVEGDLGYSRTYRVPVGEILGERLLNTFFLSFTALTLSLCIALPLGILTALKKGTRFDYALNLLAFAGQSVPPFWLGIILIMVFSVGLGWFPAGGTSSVSEELGGFAFVADRVRYLVLPVLVFTVTQVATYLRFVRGSMVEVLRNDYVRTARAKGLDRRTVLWRHAFRNALIPVVTMAALGLSTVFSGALITETVFAYQGVGKAVFDAIMANDFNLAMVSFCITVAMVLLMNLVADISYAFLDPRISYQ